METTIAQRFEALIKALKMNNNSFAVSLGKSASNIKIVVEGTSKPGFDLLELVLRTYPQVSSDWLLKGEGEMFKSDPKNTEAPTLWITLKDNYEKTIEDLRYTISLQRQLLGKYNPAPIRPSAGSNIIKLFPMFEEKEIMAIKA